jgi:hypothetical protein
MTKKRTAKKPRNKSLREFLRKSYLCEAAYNALRLEAWGYTNKAHESGLRTLFFRSPRRRT